MHAMLLISLVGCAPAKPAQRPAAAWVGATVPELGVKFSKPSGWKVELGPPVTDETRSSDPQIGGMHFAGIDDHSTVVGLLRSAIRQPGMSPDQTVADMIQAQRDASKQNEQKVVEDSQRQIAGCPAWILTTDSHRMGFDMRVMTICFVSAEFEYKLAVAGQKDFFDDVRPKVMKLIDSMELIEPNKEK